ncbi:MAG TPA: GNAT family protein [Candidatus Dormibacteraeota bacterium]
MYGPVIQGSCFRLRPPRPEEAAVMIAWFEDLEVTARLLRRWPPSLEDEQEWLKKTAADPDSVFWVIEHEGRPIGVTGIEGIDWVNGRGKTGTLIGDKSCWGKGIASEVMRLRADFAFRELPLRKLQSGYLEGNEASRRAQAAAGYREVGRFHGQFFREGRWLDEILTELLREDWEKKQADSAN